MNFPKMNCNFVNLIMQKYLLIFVFFVGIDTVWCQNEADSGFIKEIEELKSLEWVVDSSFKAIKTTNFGALKTFYPSFATYKKFIDTSLAGEQSDFTKYGSYNTIWNKHRIKHYKLMKKMKKLGVKMPLTSLDSFYLEKGKSEGVEFAYIYWIFNYNKKKQHIISAVSLKINEHWYILDELKYVGIFIDPKKQKRVKKPVKK